MASNIAEFIEYSPSHYTNSVRDFKCGNSVFSDDIWDFKGLIPGGEIWHDAKCRLDFTVFLSASIRETVKWYILSELLSVKFNSVKSKLAAFKTFRKYLEKHPDISSFNDLAKFQLEDFFKFVLSDTNVKGEPNSAVTKKKAAQVIQEVLKRGAVKGWDVPANTTHVQAMYNGLIINNRDIKKGTEFGRTTKVLPNEKIVSNLITTAFKALDEGDDILTAASIIISSQLGCRITELLSIKTGCLSMVNGEIFLTYTTSKTKKAQVEVTKPANEKVCRAIKKLEEYAFPLRKESGLPYLFLSRKRNTKGYPLQIASHANWNKNRLRPFVKQHNICDSNGKLLNLTSHYFRHICATYAYKGGMKTHDVAELLNHESILMTETYDQTEDKQKVVSEILSGEIPIVSINKMVLDSLEGDQNPFKGKTLEQIDKLRRALKIELLSHGICTHHPMRGEPCEQDGACLGCSNFLASAKHIPVYEKRLEQVNKELEMANNDNSIWTSKLHYQQGRLEYYIKELNKKMAKKEFQQAMSEVAVSNGEE
ncbi:tyrosine-type recombinase/integrase [Bacillus mycoides]